MNIEIHHERCLSCECCVSACRRRIFRVGISGRIETDGEKLRLCMRCGHCAAVCPGGAIALDGVPPASLEDVPAGLASLAETADLVLKSKRSVGAYSCRPVPREVLKKALDTANYAPSARGAHPVRWLVVDTPDKLGRLLREMLPHYARSTDETARSHYENHLHGVDSLLRGAPCVLVAYAPRDDYGEADCVIAAAYASLALHARGVGSCWAGSVLALTRKGPLPVLSLPDDCVAYAALMVGYPDVNFLKFPHRPEPVIRFL